MLIPDTRNLKPLLAIKSLTQAYRVPDSDNRQPATTNQQQTINERLGEIHVHLPGRH